MKTTTIPAFYYSEEWKQLRAAVLKRDGGFCVYCGCVGIQADHVIPRRKGGPDALDNLVCCCPRCNKVLGGHEFDSMAEKKPWLLAELKRIKKKDEAKVTTEPCNYKRISKTRGCKNPRKAGSAYCPEHHAMVIEKRVTKRKYGNIKCSYQSRAGAPCTNLATCKIGKFYCCDKHKKRL